MNGTVKLFNTAKGFGYIEPDEGGRDVFVHASALEAAGIRVLNEGDRVSFELEDDRKGDYPSRPAISSRIANSVSESGTGPMK